MPGLPGGSGLISWDRFFRCVDGLLKACRKLRITPLRRKAIAAATQWMLDRFEASDGLGAIFPPILFSAVALRALGYRDDSPEMRYCLHQLEDLVIEDVETDSVRLEPCKSPVWDTAITARALAAAGTPGDHPAMRRGAEWLLDQQILRPGDWSKTVEAEPAGWCFEFRNDFYPDVDDTIMVLMALAEQYHGTATSRAECGVGDTGGSAANGPRTRIGRLPIPLASGTRKDSLHRSDEALLSRSTTAIDRGLKWLLAMQNDDGGWASFDRNNDRQFLCYVPFADHNAMIDPSTPDITGPCLGSSRETRSTARRSGRRRRCLLPSPYPGGRRKLGGTVGSQLHLRHVASARGIDKRRHPQERSHRHRRGRMAVALPAIVRRLGRVAG